MKQPKPRTRTLREIGNVDVSDFDDNKVTVEDEK